jgi:hypothetical protein
MPAPLATTTVAPTTNKTAADIRHEEFCLPRLGLAERRIESYVHFDDDPKSGRSRPTHDVTRCLECGAANYQPRS